MATVSRQMALWVCLHCVWFLHQAESNFFVDSPDAARGDVSGSAALEWTLESEPERDDAVSFTFKGGDVFRYIPYTGVIRSPIVDGPVGNASNSSSYDPRFAIYNTSTSGVGFRLKDLRPEDAGRYTCIYESLPPTPPRTDAVLFVYDFPGRPVIEANPGTLVDGVTTLSLECSASSTSLPVVYRPAMLYTWSRNGMDINRTGPPARHAVLGDRRQFLEISPVHLTDTSYTCTASESGTQLTSEETNFTLDILYGPYNLKTNPEKPSARENEALGITLNTSTGEHTIPGEFWTTDGGVTSSRAAPSPFRGSFIATVVSAAAGGLVFLVIVILVAACCARRQKRFLVMVMEPHRPRVIDLPETCSQTHCGYISTQVSEGNKKKAPCIGREREITKRGSSFRSLKKYQALMKLLLLSHTMNSMIFL